MKELCMEKILFISPSSLDRKSLLLTLIVSVFPIILFGWVFYRSLAAGNTLSAVFACIFVALFLVILIVGIVNTPYKYVLTNAHLIVKRHLKDIVIPLENIKYIRLMTKDDKKGLIRIFGAEGSFGAYGYYQTALHKNLIVFVRRYNNWALVVTDQKKYVIAPDDLQLIDMAAQQIGRTETENLVMDAPTRQWIKWILVAPMVGVALLMYFSYREPNIVIDANSFKMNGVYGVNLRFDEISEADTIAWGEMPRISLRTNGISLFKVNRGHFVTTTRDKIRLSVYRGVSPVIKIVDHRGRVYYINRKDADETRRIFNQLGIKK